MKSTAVYRNYRAKLSDQPHGGKDDVSPGFGRLEPARTSLVSPSCRQNDLTRELNRLSYPTGEGPSRFVGWLGRASGEPRRHRHDYYPSARVTHLRGLRRHGNDWVVRRTQTGRVPLPVRSCFLLSASSGAAGPRSWAYWAKPDHTVYFRSSLKRNQELQL